MGLFSKISRLFSKPIILPEGAKGDLISVSSLGLGKYKVGKEIKIENGYRLVTVHYNEVCDSLHEGTYKIDSLDMPRLFNACRKRLLGKDLKSVTADIYYVNMREFQLNFECKEKIKVYAYTGPASVKVIGEFSFVVTDAALFMQNLCSDYAIIKNKIALRDVSSIVASDVAYLLRKRIFDLSKIIKSDDELTRYLIDNLEKIEAGCGIRVTQIAITDVKAPKGYEREVESVKDTLAAQDDLLQEAELHTSSGEEEEPIFVKVGGFEEPKTTAPYVRDYQENDKIEQKNDDFSTKIAPIDDSNAHIEQLEPNIISVEKDESAPAVVNESSSPALIKTEEKVDEKIESKQPIEEPQQEIADTPQEEVKAIKNCPCCGTPNEINAKTCKVCGSNF